MTDPKKRLAEQLLAADPPSPDGRTRYEREVRAMLDKTLTPRQRGVYLLAAVLALAAAGFCGWAATRVPPGQAVSQFLTGYAVITAGALLFAAVVYFVVFWKGVVTPSARQRGWAGVGVVYVGLVGWLIAGSARMAPEEIRDEVRILGFVLMLFAATAWVRNRVARAELRTAEKLLELELRLAELGDAVADRPRGVAPPTT